MTPPTLIETLIFIPPLAIGFVVWFAWNKRLWLKSHHPERLTAAPGLESFVFIFCAYQLTVTIFFNFDFSEKIKHGLFFLSNLIGIAVALYIWKERKLSFSTQLIPLKKHLWRSLIHLLTLYPLILVAFTINSYWIESHHPMVDFLLNTPLNFFEFLIYCFGTAIIIPIFEEILYRGFLQSGLQKIFGLLPALIIQCTIFTVMHPPHSYLPIFILACALTFVSHWSHSLIAPIIIHIFFNSITCFELSVNKFGLWWQ